MRGRGHERAKKGGGGCKVRGFVNTSPHGNLWRIILDYYNFGLIATQNVLGASRDPAGGGGRSCLEKHIWTSRLACCHHLQVYRGGWMDRVHSVGCPRHHPPARWREDNTQSAFQDWEVNKKEKKGGYLIIYIYNKIIKGLNQETKTHQRDQNSVWSELKNLCELEIPSRLQSNLCMNRWGAELWVSPLCLLEISSWSAQLQTPEHHHEVSRQYVEPCMSRLTSGFQVRSL